MSLKFYNKNSLRIDQFNGFILGNIFTKHGADDGNRTRIVSLEG